MSAVVVGGFIVGIGFDCRARPLDRPQRRWGGLPGKPPEVFLGQLQHFGCLHVAHYGHGHVGWSVERIVELPGICGGEGVKVAHPADGRVVVGMGRESGGAELFDESSDGLALAQAPLLLHHVPFLVELPEDRPEEALALQVLMK